MKRSMVLFVTVSGESKNGQLRKICAFSWTGS